MERFWLKHYPPGVPADVDVAQYSSLVQLMDEAFAKFAARDAYAFMDRHFTFAEIDRQSAAFGAWLQERGLARGARVALMMPNVVQYPIALAGVLRAGCVVVNVNPLYTPRELEHQLKDSGAEAIVILENFCTTLQQVIANAGQARRGRFDRRHAGLPEEHHRQSRAAPSEEDGAGVFAAGPREVRRRARRGRARQARAGRARALGRRVPAVHRRHDGRVEGRDADAPQPGRERAAARGVDAAFAQRCELAGRCPSSTSTSVRCRSTTCSR